ncbi:hypothetical protein ACIFQM_00920 [Paenibacillus sp. NRS-1782]|uniref:hypothetical protein n=1 Tax=unclassified Paenibacillus TaxID=185978 RepID=UPI003D2B051D
MRRLTDEEFLARIEELVGREYTFLQPYTTSKTLILVRHNKCEYEYRVRPNDFLQGSRCPRCFHSKPKRYISQEEFLARVEKLTGQEYTFLQPYEFSSIPLMVRHNKCGFEYKVKPNNFFQGHRCSNCFNLKQRTSHEEFLASVAEQGIGEYTVLGQYKNSKTKILMRHDECGHEYRVTPNDFSKGARCPICRKSKGELKIVNFLKDANIEYIPQYSFANLKYKAKLSFDFAVFKDEKLLCLVEYDGEQHFQPVKAFGGKEGFAKGKKRDQLKNQYCKDNEIKLIRIPFTQFDNVEGILERELKILSKRK